MDIRAALLTQPREPFRIETLHLEAPRSGEVLVRMQAVGVCHSDWHLVTGATRHPLPVVAGHEGAGVVEAVGEGVTRLKPGDRVILSWAPDCGECFYCLAGKPNLCETYTGPIWEGVMLDGSPRLSWNGAPVYHYCGLAAFAEYAVVPEPSCIRLQAQIAPEVAALVGCAVATGVGAALYTSPVRPGQSVAIYGCGGVGLSAVLGAALSGAAQIIAVDPQPDRLQAARALGATHAFTPEAALDGIRALTGGRGADIIFEAAGAPAVQEAAFRAVRPGGALTLVGLAPMGTPTNLPGAEIVRRELTIHGSYYGSVNAHRDFPMLVDLFQAGRLPLDRLVTRSWRLHEINEAYADMLAGSGARSVIVF
jgi:S-(hydroxymethyl)glutathione dehydrogenase/alcohol dehydrogenase